tara:strand:- start:1886 stop:2530 length:645 start_codon:yes stop_codon:yes gene_type:complete
MNTQDEIRDNIMRVLHKIHINARSPTSIAKGIRDITQAVKTEYDYKQQEISSNLDYLIQKGWVIKEQVDKTFTTKQGVNVTNPQLKYKISDTGIDRYEEASTFRRVKQHPTFNITNINGVTVIGDGNVVNCKFTELMNELDKFKSEVEQSGKIDETQKLETIADIESIQSQLIKPNPNKSVVKALFEPLSNIATIAGVYNAFELINTLIQPLLK